jgi:hypothetical protein
MAMILLFSGFGGATARPALMMSGRPEPDGGKRPHDAIIAQTPGELHQAVFPGSVAVSVIGRGTKGEGIPLFSLVGSMTKSALFVIEPLK